MVSGSTPPYADLKRLGIKILSVQDNHGLAVDVKFLAGVTTLTSLTLRHTGIFGDLDAVISANAGLELIFVEACAFDGPFPASLASATYLQYAALDSNNWTTSLSGLVFNQTNLQSLSVSNAHLSGSLPAFLPPSLTSLQLASNALSGTLPDYFRSMTQLSTLDLSYNNFSGDLNALRMCTNQTDPKTWCVILRGAPAG